MEARRRLVVVMSKWLISILLAGAAMAQSSPAPQPVVWQRAKTGAAARQATADKPADPKVATAQATATEPATDPEVAEAVRWERAKDRAAQRQIAKSKK
jgi:hypothetical protein